MVSLPVLGMMTLGAVAGVVVARDRGLFGTGPRVLVDHEDGILGLLMWTGILVVVGFGVPASMVMKAKDAAMHHHPGAALFALLFGVAWVGVALWMYSRAIKTVLRSRPGELRVPVHPLPEGETVEVAFTRKIDQRCELQWLRGAIVFERKESHWHDGKRRTRWVVCGRHELGSGDVAHEHGEVVAVWRFQVPDSQAPSALWGFLFGHRHRWKFLVTFEFTDLPDSSSKFPIRIQRTA